MWPWVLDAFGLLCIYLIGRKLWWGWLVYQLYNLSWMVYAICTKQWGFLPGFAVYAVINHKNMMEWKGKKQ